VTASDLLALIERTFPYLPRPSPPEIPAHTDGCGHCEMMWRELSKYPGPELPDAAIRFLWDEMNTLSAKATAWVLPSYLRYVVSQEDEQDPLPTEFLIYNLGPASEHADESRGRLSHLTTEQIETLRALVEHLKGDARWSEYCGDDLDRADAFLRGLLSRASCCEPGIAAEPVVAPDPRRQ
jgi:hypothetical protein